MTPLPKSIRVGYRDVEVVEVAASEMRSHEVDGHFDDSGSAIRISDGLRPARRACVLLHETLHACWSSGELDAKSAEEKAVTVLANQLTQVWRDNPEFVAFMSASLSPEPTEPRKVTKLRAA